MRKYPRQPPTPAREVTCERCGVKFLTRTKGKTKYCIECKVDTHIEHQRNLKRVRRGGKL